jgi:hypothetical protein
MEMIVLTFEKSLINYYHEFKHTHEVQIERWQVYLLPNYVSIIMVLWPQVLL